MKTKTPPNDAGLLSNHLCSVLDSIVFGNKKPNPPAQIDNKLSKKPKIEQAEPEPEPDSRTKAEININAVSSKRNGSYDGHVDAARRIAHQLNGQKPEIKTPSLAEQPLANKGIKPSSSSSVSSWLDEARKRKAELASSSFEKSGSDIQAEYIRTVSPSRTGLIRLQKFECATRHRSICSSMGFLDTFGSAVDKSQVLWSTDFGGSVVFTRILKSRCAPATSIELRTPILSACASSDKSRIICVGGSTKLSYVDIETQQVNTIRPLRTEEGATLKQVVTMDRSVCVLDDYGRIYHIDDRTKRACRSFNSASVNTCMAFDPSSALRLISGDSNGELFEWDLGIGRCVNRHRVDGVLNITSLATAGENRLLVGSQSGYVSVLGLSDLSYKIKDFGNLTTQIDVICGHSSAPLALMSSPVVDGAFRLLYTGDKPFVYQNWPGDERTKFRGITAVAFSENDGFLSIGDKTGIVRLWSLPDLACCILPSTFK